MALCAQIFQKALNGQRSFHRWLAPTLREFKRRKDRMGEQPPQPRKTYAEWNYDAELFAFGKRLGEEFDKQLLRQAFTERSYIIQEEKKLESVGVEPNLQFEDNSVLVQKGEERINEYVKEYLTHTLPKLPLEYVMNIHQALTNNEALAKVSKNIGIDDLMLSTDWPVGEVELARGLKGVVGILEEERAWGLVRDLVLARLAGTDITQWCTPLSPWDTLVSTLKRDPEPRLIGQAGPTSLLAAYQVALYLDMKFIARGFGETIETAKEMAACDYLWRTWNVNPDKKPFPFRLQRDQIVAMTAR